MLDLDQFAIFLLNDFRYRAPELYVTGLIVA